MGEAKLRGSFDERKAQAIAAGRSHAKRKFEKFYGGLGYFATDGHRNSSIYIRKPHRLNRAWKRRAAGI